MYLRKLRIKNFRRLRDVLIDLAADLSIFVGANNSGKTSVGHALQVFTGKSRFSIYDFSADLWTDIVAFGEGGEGTSLPAMEIDLWFEINQNDIHRVVELLPSLSWDGALVGMRIAYVPRNAAETYDRYAEMRRRVLAAAARNENGELIYDPSPKNMKDFLRDRLHDEYELSYSVLDPARFDENMVGEEGYVPVPLTGQDRSGREILNSLIHIDFLNAQRHLSDHAGGARSEDLSRVLSRFYGRNLEQKGEDSDVLRALAASEASLNDHLERVFEPTLKSLSKLGYPGLSNPRMMIRSALDPVHVMSGRDSTVVHYALGVNDGNPNPPSLPDKYNGLGFKNLIYMVVELLDLQAQWLAMSDSRPPIHLIFIEEPEAHLHAQLQQAFIRKLMEILVLSPEDRVHNTNQVLVTTHSTHILYERGFRPIRYFRRSRNQELSSSEVLNLSVFYDSTDEQIRSFLERYLKLAHCDLFFADGVVLVEGNVERLLLPQMIESAAPRLQSSYLTVLEIGGAFGYRFKELIEFLGLTALIVTDLDSIFGPPPQDDANGEVVQPLAERVEALEENIAEVEEDEGEEDEGEEQKPGKACIAGQPGARTSNQTLLQWLPKCGTVEELWNATEEQKLQGRVGHNDALIRVAYQCRTDVTWAEETLSLAGRTLEEAFALENLEWCQHADRKHLKLRIPKSGEKNLADLAERIHKRVQSKSFGKTDFALALLAEEPASWKVPTYISEGLIWLENEVAPLAPAQVEVNANGDNEEPQEGVTVAVIGAQV